MSAAVNYEYTCPFCYGLLTECDESHFLSFEGWKRGEEITIYVFFCEQCREIFHCNGAEVHHV